MVKSNTVLASPDSMESMERLSSPERKPECEDCIKQFVEEYACEPDPVTTK